MKSRKIFAASLAAVLTATSASIVAFASANAGAATPDISDATGGTKSETATKADQAITVTVLKDTVTSFSVELTGLTGLTATADENTAPTAATEIQLISGCTYDSTNGKLVIAIDQAKITAGTAEAKYAIYESDTAKTVTVSITITQVEATTSETTSSDTSSTTSSDTSSTTSSDTSSTTSSDTSSTTSSDTSSTTSSDTSSTTSSTTSNTSESGPVYVDPTPTTPTTSDTTTTSTTTSDTNSSAAATVDPIDTKVEADVKVGETVTVKSDALGGDVTVATDKDDTALAGAKVEVAATNKKDDTTKKLNDAVGANASTEVKAVVDAAVKAVEDGNAVTLDISFTKDGKDVQPGKDVTVTAPVPAAIKGADKVYVYHVTDKGLEDVTSKTKYDKDKGTIAITNNAFSPYIVSKVEIKAAAANTSGSSSTTASNTSNPSNPSTGVALAVAPIVLAGAAVAIVSMKKRK